MTGDPVFKLKRDEEGGGEAGGKDGGGTWRRLDMKADETAKDNKRAVTFWKTDEAYSNSQTFFIIRGYCKRRALLGAAFGACASTGVKPCQTHALSHSRVRVQAHAPHSHHLEDPHRLKPRLDPPTQISPRKRARASTARAWALKD